MNRFVLNRAGIEELRRSHAIVPFLLRVGGAVAVAAHTRGVFPGRRAYQTRPSVTTDTDRGETVVRVAAAGPFAAVEEFGTFRTPARSTLRNAARSLGLTFDETARPL